MYVSPISALLAGGRSTPAIRAMVLSSLSLSLLVFRVYADDSHHALAVDHLALVTNFLDGRSYLHKISFTAGSAPTAHSRSPQRNARSAPNWNRLWSPPSTCLSGLGLQAL